ncbi:unnamed protein product [Paramecium octaurelia]|uniref:5'-3' exoribonuclease n=1 Tax=Paramecium octaurelia TaxID=43137 RepID=A0A8S1U3R3_PAROT|nr:unnamed protein product [Paramecium octaurelia]
MGVPAFFRWLCARNPKALLEVLENSDESCLSNNPDIDNLYLDMNGIIHPCSHPDQGGIPIPVTYDDMFVNVFHYIDRLVDIVRPKELIYMAIDGVAPRAKLNQQRSRRFRAAQESIRIQKEKERLRDYWRTQGLNSDALNTYIEKNFDSNQITPGTEFMQKLNIALQYYIYDRMNNNPLFRNILIIFNDSSIPGEGEHKILQFVRDQRKQMNYKTVRHCLYGADADLIMLGLSTHEPYFYVIRETIMANDDKQCSICQQKGHFFTDCKKREKVIDDLNGEIKQYNQIQQQQKTKLIQVDFQILQLNIVREFLYFETRDLQASLKGQYDLERIIDDFVFMCFLVGNDFLPHIPCLKITEGGIDCLLIIYKTILSQIGDYLTNCGELNLQQMNQFLFHVGLIEDELIKGQEKKKEIVKNRRERNAEMKEQKIMTAPEFSIVDTQKEILSKFKSALKEKLTEINQQEIDQAQSAKSSQELKKWKAVSYKQRYYQEKFGIKPTQFREFQHRIKISYLEALAWTLKYYYQGCVDWGWFYPYHYAPFAQDLTNLDQCMFEFSLNTPFKPYQQLLAVLPPQSAQFLPRPYQQLMLESSSPIADFYPTDFVVDLKGKKFAWLGEVVLPFVDADRLIKASNIGVNLSKLEQERDRLGQTLIFSLKKHEIFNFQQCHIQVQVDWLPRFPVGSEIKSPIPTMGNILNNQIICGALLKTMIESDASFIQNQIRKGTIMPPEFLDEYYMNQCEQNKRSFGGEAVRRIVYSILGVKQVRRLDRSQDDFDQIKKQTKL